MIDTTPARGKAFQKHAIGSLVGKLQLVAVSGRNAPDLGPHVFAL